MPFTEMELVWLLKAAGQKDVDIAVRVGSHDKTIRNIKKGLGRKSSAYEDGLEIMVSEFVSYPWSQLAHDQVRRMLGLIRTARWNDFHKSYAFSGESSFNLAMQIDSEGPVSEDDWGHALVAYAFKLGMQLSSLTAHVQHREGWEEAAGLMLKLLGKSNEDWAKVLRFKVAGNRIILVWKRTPHEKRANAEMRELIETSGYSDHLIGFNEIIPKDPVAPFNALAIASRFGNQDRYQDLYERLVKADGRYRNLETLEDPDFDTDFDDFRRWYRSNRKKVA
ncbi:hypothetical protein [Roseibium sediminicola]|uniref:HTH luxR-type domain-containing protein n=1 Tax=Roseibium sediminicola TaxID=2933272 RepID=A0ABT0H2X9_9HYPH|nr:hypothetical protein [Roseibium sp. CAU 1639]MCK7616021.1 hypothetical protein [Roseibium sp. CAU 1639]